MGIILGQYMWGRRSLLTELQVLIFSEDSLDYVDFLHIPYFVDPRLQAD